MEKETSTDTLVALVEIGTKFVPPYTQFSNCTRGKDSTKFQFTSKSVVVLH